MALQWCGFFFFLCRDCLRTHERKGGRLVLCNREQGIRFRVSERRHEFQYEKQLAVVPIRLLVSYSRVPGWLS